jgi:hypothetical protein
VGIRLALPGAIHGIKLTAPHQPHCTRKSVALRFIQG